MGQPVLAGQVPDRRPRPGALQRTSARATTSRPRRRSGRCWPRRARTGSGPPARARVETALARPGHARDLPRLRAGRDASCPTRCGGRRARYPGSGRPAAGAFRAVGYLERDGGVRDGGQRRGDRRARDRTQGLPRARLRGRAAARGRGAARRQAGRRLARRAPTSMADACAYGRSVCIGWWRSLASRTVVSPCAFRPASPATPSLSAEVRSPRWARPGLHHRRRLVGHRRVPGAERARHRLRLLREGLAGRRQLALRERQRHVVRLPLAVHQHLAQDDGVRGLPDAAGLSRLPAPHPDRPLLR